MTTPTGPTGVPVVLIAFNRPRLTERSLDALRTVRPTQVFVVADGPRPGHDDDPARCAEVRQLLDGIDWPCDVRQRRAPTNLGLEANVELGLDWVFGQVDRAIVLEDDCLPDPSFFAYAEELLDRYRDDQRVWQISGSGLGVPRSFFGPDSYAFTAWASVWGWATWADRWQQHRAMFPRDHAPGSLHGDAPVRTVAFAARPGLLVTPAAERHFAEAALSDDTVTHGWDKHWWLSMMTVGALAISPAVNLVENVGWGADATHGVAHGKRDRPAEAAPDPLHHPTEVAINHDVERELELVLDRLGGRAAQLARRIITSPRMRHVVRTAVNSRAGAAAHRLVTTRSGGRRG